MALVVTIGVIITAPILTTTESVTRPTLSQLLYHNYDLDKDITLERGKDNYPLMNQLNISTTNPELPKVSPSLPKSSELVAAVSATVAFVALMVYWAKYRKTSKSQGADKHE